MINEALINRQMQNISTDEAARAEKFHANRIPFFWYNNQFTYNKKAGDVRDHQHWLLEDFGISQVEFENIPRGYIKDGRIQLFIGSRFDPVDLSSLVSNWKEQVIRLYQAVYNNEVTEIYNGVHIGKIGDVWEPVQKIPIK